jgi:hypothetical protein
MRIVGGIVGGIGIGAAVILLGLAALIGLSAAMMQNQVEHFTPVEKWANDWSGQAKKNDAQIGTTAMAAVAFGVGAVLCGGVGAVFLILSFVMRGKPLFPNRQQAVAPVGPTVGFVPPRPPGQVNP